MILFQFFFKFACFIIVLYFFLLQRLSTLNRANLLNDAFSLAAVGELDYDTVLHMCSYLTEECHSGPWEVATSNLVSIYNLLNSRGTMTGTARTFQVIYRNIF